jgi:hypothetical protein
MKTITLPKLALLAVTLFPQALLGQGTFPPTTAPAAPIMKTLGQIEPRGAVQALAATPPYTISQSGSYYLTGNVSVASGNAIVINADNVTLDLNGFTITSTSGGSGVAISVFNAHKQITVTNGSIGAGVGATTGFEHGIYCTGALSQGLVKNIHVSNVGSYGILLDQQGSVESCTVKTAGGIGISAERIRDSSAASCASFGLNGGVISNCYGETTSTNANPLAAASGIKASVLAEKCNGTALSGIGVDAPTAEGCVGVGTYIGIRAITATDCRGTSLNTGIKTEIATNSKGYSYQGIGIDTIQASNCYGYTSNNTAANFGISATGTVNSCRAEGGGASSTALKAAVAIGCTYTNGLLVVPAGKTFNM